MARIILVTGGARSGKSDCAQRLAESLPGRRAYVATCPVLDDEMRSRIAKHRQAREAGGWDTIEETLRLDEAIRAAARYEVLLVDCVTLWVNNLMYEAERSGCVVSERDVQAECGQALAAAESHDGAVIFVTNEVGMGIVPDNPLARRYRDLVGRCNQMIAAAADRVVLMVCGMEVVVKG